MRVGLLFLTLAFLCAAPTAAARSAELSTQTLSQEQIDSVSEALTAAAQAEVEAKSLPSFVFAIVDSSGIRLSGAHGFSDAAKTKTVDLNSTYRVGSVSKLFTDILVMQMVESGKLDLDAPVQKYLPDFRPDNSFGKPITLRQLMAHRSGLVREPPVGSYFHTDEPSLAATVESLNRTVTAPGEVTRYSNAGLAVVGRVLEVVSGIKYEDLLQQRLFGPLGMSKSGFSRARAPAPVYSEMASYDGPRFAAPQFDLGMSPAGNLYTSANDLSKAAQMLLRAGKASGKTILTGKSLTEMWRPQFGVTQPRKFGLGFILADVDGHRTVGHTGGIYGFSTDFRVLPDEGFAVLTFSALDDNRSAQRFTDYAIHTVLAARAGASLPEFFRTQRLGTAAAKRLAGRFRNGADTLVLRSLGEALYLEGPEQAAEVRTAGGAYYLDDANSFSSGISIDPLGQSVSLNGRVFRRWHIALPPPPSPRVASLIGDYGWEHNYIRVYERDGKPYVRIEWTSWQPMRIIDDNRWAFSEQGGLYPRESLVFTRDANGQGGSISLNGIVFPRRHFGDEVNAVVRGTVKGSPSLREQARAASPPQETGTFVKPDLVELTSLDRRLRLDIRYASTNNFIGFPLYREARAFLQRPAAEAVKRANSRLAAKGYGLTIHDSYRPWFVTKMFWDATPAEGKLYVADPSQGSRHNRGAAVDLTMHDLSTGKVVSMPGGYDEMSVRSSSQYLGGTSRQRWLRDLLRDAMEAEASQSMKRNGGTSIIPTGAATPFRIWSSTKFRRPNLNWLNWQVACVAFAVSVKRG